MPKSIDLDNISSVIIKNVIESLNSCDYTGIRDITNNNDKKDCDYQYAYNAFLILIKLDIILHYYI